MSSRKRAPFPVLLVLLLASGPASARQTSAESLLSSADEVIREVAKIRQVAIPPEFRKGVRSKEEIRSYIVKRVAEEFPRKEIEAEERLLKKLRLIPSDLDYYPFMLDLLTEQIAGFYDPEDDTLYIADWIPPELQKPVLAHEIAHALQDRIFDLETVLSPVEGNDDETLARSALIEGEGLLVMLAYNLEPFGRKLTDLNDIAAMNRAQLPLMEQEYPTFARAPNYLKETLLFPYSYGADFLMSFLRNHPWKEVDGLYRAFPISTEQVLHPEKYFDTPDLPTPVEFPEGVPESNRVVFQNTLGEFSLSLVLQTYLGREQSEAAAAGWDGDRVRLTEDASGAETLELVTVWDTRADAEEFLDAAMDLLRLKYQFTAPWADVARDNTRRISGQSETGAVLMVSEGLRVYLRETNPK